VTGVAAILQRGDQLRRAFGQEDIAPEDDGVAGKMNASSGATSINRADDLGSRAGRISSTASGNQNAPTIRNGQKQVSM